MQTENDVRNRISAVFAEFGETQNKLAGGDSATQKRLNRQLSDNGAAITVDTLLLILNKHNDVSAEWLLRGTGDMRILPGGMDAPEDVEIARLESTVETLLDRIAGYKNRIKELEAALPEQKKECRIIKMYHRT